jgi:hypothetical protein
VVLSNIDSLFLVAAHDLAKSYGCRKKGQGISVVNQLWKATSKEKQCFKS